LAGDPRGNVAATVAHPCGASDEAPRRGPAPVVWARAQATIG